MTQKYAITMHSKEGDIYSFRIELESSVDVAELCAILLRSCVSVTITKY